MALTTHLYLAQKLAISRATPHTPPCACMAHHGKAFTVLLLTNVANSAFIVAETVHRNRSLHDLIIVLP